MWRDSFVAMRMVATSEPSSSSTPSSSHELVEDGGEEDDYLLQVERRVRALRRNTQNDFVDQQQVAHAYRFHQALASLAQQQELDTKEKLQHYRDDNRLSMDHFFISSQPRPSSTQEVFMNNPLVEAGEGESVKPPLSSFRQRITQFQDQLQDLKEENEEAGEKFKRRMSGLGKSLKKSLSFRGKVIE
ncbi:hypothetical protein BASA81_003194 [Batrachochytrium salamandrivorans]|nr:hypothetical protein BASA81_003194 [Batrachochytrium salamandrivorans]